MHALDLCSCSTFGMSDKAPLDVVQGSPADMADGNVCVQEPGAEDRQQKAEEGPQHGEPGKPCQQDCELGETRNEGCWMGRQVAVEGGESAEAHDGMDSA